MQLPKATADSLALANASAITDETYSRLLENCMAALTVRSGVGPGPESDIAGASSKGDLVKELRAALLSATTHFARHDIGAEAASRLLQSDCGYGRPRADAFAASYARAKVDLQLLLANVGSHLPHVVAVDWKIDYVVKSSELDRAEGPLFRVTLTTERHDPIAGAKKRGAIVFACTAQELQELVYKLKDCARHCQRVAAD